VYFLPSEEGRRSWALIPAAALLVMGLVFGVFGIPSLNSFWPVLLILGGIYVVARSLGWGRR
jgi:fatty acid desaturase